MKHQRREGIGGRITSVGIYLLFGMVAGLLVVAGCSDSSGAPQLPVTLGDAGVDSQGDTGGPDMGGLTCRPSPHASENLDPRVDVIAPAMQGAQVIKTSDLFTRFNSICGGCHVAAANGGFQVTAATFPTVFDASRLARIESNDPSFAMPPVGRAFSSRGPDDPVRQLAELLQIWLDQGRPVDMFVADSSSVPSNTGAAPYSYSVMTNLGNCVPPPAMYASSSSTEMTAKDAFFANATSLPNNLADTDLTTFDSATLAANGLIAYRPTYPLWSDGSGKLRFIRVPKGTSIKFDKATQTFDIPPNTRFYKTFFREVIDKAGHVSHKKMETRLIVTRSDTVDTDGVTPLPQALYGTYLWSDDEMTATLWANPNRDGTGFSDLTEEYVTNEIVYQDVIDNLGPGAASLAVKLKNELSDPKHLGLIQHYAVPGSIRCVQCHRGSPSKDFVLGFYPLQVAQRVAGTGGTYEPVDADELNQLQRFIDYGLITGMASPADVVPLESSQQTSPPPRSPRTPEELKAQAYMIGNCAHCHNPRGYPSLAKPELATALNFLPGSTPEAGIFEFDFEKMSPVRSRGANQSVPIPYITPSLRDYPVADDGLVRVDNGVQLRAPDPNSSTASEVTWSPKYDYEVEGPGGLGCANPARDVNLESFCRGRTAGHTFVPAPWRSLIYRNVDTPFPYFDDYVPFPHMPMNTAGFDCRAPQIMGSWMVGLPAILKPKYRNLLEDTIPYARNPDGTYPPYFIDAPQPYQEVKPGDDGYDQALAAARERISEYQNGIRYQYCQDVLSPDILDPVPTADLQFGVSHNAQTFYPIADRYLFGGVPPSDPSRPGQYVQPAIGVPYHAEWFDYDPTDVFPWQPRRADWTSVIVEGKPDTATQLGLGADPTGAKAAALVDSRRRLADALQKAQLTEDLRRYATTEVPYALWKTKTGCETKLAAPNIKKFSDTAFTGSNRPAWMDQVHPSPDAPVYMISPGAALYRHICINCHGPKADGKGLQSDALAASSEGKTRPANLSGGLFGPLDSLGSNLLATFGQNTGDRTVADNWASHYMAWMTLGGTLQLIPQDVINQVEATTIFGAKRQNLSDLGDAETVSANMLNLAKGLCAVVLPDVAAGTALTPTLQPDAFSSNFAFPSATAFAPLNFPEAPFVRTNGDWDMWMNLCSRYNRQLVRVFVAQDGPDTVNHEVSAPLRAIYYADDGSNPPAYQYPADATGHYGVWDQKQQIHYDGVTPDNYYPTCLARGPIRSGATGPDPVLVDALQAKLKMPYCDPAFLQHNELILWSASDTGDAAAVEIDRMREWALHGAINAAMSVFSYLEGADLAHNKLPPYYNQCELLP